MLETSAGVVVFYMGLSLRYLVLHYEEGHWDLPKGHVEGNEELQETALRETKEETGLTPALKSGFQEKISYFYKNKQGLLKNKTVYFFLGESSAEEVTLSDEHIGYAWLSFEKALEKLTYDTAKSVLKKANKFLTQKTLSDY